jgi:hypothetical protein
MPIPRSLKIALDLPLRDADENGPANLAIASHASRVLNEAGVRLMEIDGMLTVGIWSDLDSPEIREALRLLNSADIRIRYLDGVDIPDRFKVRDVAGESVPMNVLAEMVRNPTEPWKVRDCMLEEMNVRFLLRLRNRIGAKSQTISLRGGAKNRGQRTWPVQLQRLEVRRATVLLPVSGGTMDDSDMQTKPEKQKQRTPEEPCPTCGQRQYWRPVTGPFRCASCEPWGKLDRVEQWWYVVP